MAIDWEKYFGRALYTGQRTKKDDEEEQKYYEQLAKQEAQQQPAAKKAYDPQKQVAGYERRIEGAGLNPEQETDNRNIIEKGLNLQKDQNFLFDIFELIGRPQQAAFGAVNAALQGKNPLEGGWKGLSGQQFTYGGDILRNLGVPDSGSGIGIDDVAGFAMDVFADPMDLALWAAAPFTGGATGAVSLSINTTQALNKAQDIAKVASTSLDAAKAAGKVDDIAKWTAQLSKANDAIKVLQAKKLLTDPLEAAAKALLDAEKLGDAAAIKKAKDAYEVALTPLKVNKNTLDMLGRGVKEGLGLGAKVADEGMQKFLSKVDDINQANPEFMKQFTGTNQYKGLTTRYKDFKHRMKSIFDAAAVIPKGVLEKSKQVGGKITYADMINKMKMETWTKSLDEVATALGRTSEELGDDILNLIEFNELGRTTSLFDIIANKNRFDNPIDIKTYERLKEVIQRQFGNTYNIDNMFTLRTIDGVGERMFFNPQADDIFDEMVKEIGKKNAEFTRTLERQIKSLIDSETITPTPGMEQFIDELKTAANRDEQIKVLKKYYNAPNPSNVDNYTSLGNNFVLPETPKVEEPVATPTPKVEETAAAPEFKREIEEYKVKAFEQSGDFYLKQEAELEKLLSKKGMFKDSLPDSPNEGSQSYQNYEALRDKIEEMFPNSTLADDYVTGYMTQANFDKIMSYLDDIDADVLEASQEYLGKYEELVGRLTDPETPLDEIPKIKQEIDDLYQEMSDNLVDMDFDETVQGMRSYEEDFVKNKDIPEATYTYNGKTEKIKKFTADNISLYANGNSRWSKRDRFLTITPKGATLTIDDTSSFNATTSKYSLQFSPKDGGIREVIFGFTKDGELVKEASDAKVAKFTNDIMRQEVKLENKTVFEAIKEANELIGENEIVISTANNPKMIELKKKAEEFLISKEQQEILNRIVSDNYGKPATIEELMKRPQWFTVINGKVIDANYGYQVAYSKIDEVKVDSLQEVLAYAEKRKLTSYGVWQDGGKYYIDTTSTFVEDPKRAALLGIYGKQSSIIDWRKLSTGADGAFLSPEEFAQVHLSPEDLGQPAAKAVSATTPKATPSAASVVDANYTPSDFSKVTTAAIAQRGQLPPSLLNPIQNNPTIKKLMDDIGLHEQRLAMAAPDTSILNYSQDEYKRFKELNDLLLTNSEFRKAYESSKKLFLDVAGAVDDAAGTGFRQGIFDGYVRHAQTQEWQNIPRDLDFDITKTTPNQFKGETRTFAGRQYRGSAVEANRIVQEQIKMALEGNFLNDAQREFWSKNMNIKMFETAIQKSMADFITETPQFGKHIAMMEEVMVNSIVQDPQILRPLQAGEKVPLGYQVVGRQQLIDKMSAMMSYTKNPAFETAINKLKAIAAPNLIIDDNIFDLVGRLSSNKAPNELLTLLDKANNMFKKTKLLSPGFQLRNMSGNLFNIWASGVPTQDVLQNMKRSIEILQKGDSITRKVVENGIDILTDNEKQIYQFYRMFIENGFDKMANKLYDIPEDILKQVNPAKQNLFQRIVDLNGKANEVTDKHFRMSLMIYGAENPEAFRKLGLNSPSELVRRVLFDPNDLSKVERDVIKKVVPFYTFAKKNLAFQMRNIVENPQRYVRVQRSLDSMWKAINIDPRTEIEAYKRENFWVPIPFISKDGEYVAIKLSLPAGDLGEFVQNPLKKVVASTTPIIRAPFELVMNKQAFSDMPIQEFQGQKGYLIPEIDRKAEYLLGQLGLDVPVSTAMDVSRAATNVATGQPANLFKDLTRSVLNYGSVAKTQQGQAYDELEILRQRMKYYKQQGIDIPTIAEIENRNRTKKTNDIISRIRQIAK